MPPHLSTSLTTGQLLSRNSQVDLKNVRTERNLLSAFQWPKTQEQTDLLIYSCPGTWQWDSVTEFAAVQSCISMECFRVEAQTLHTSAHTETHTHMVYEGQGVHSSNLYDLMIKYQITIRAPQQRTTWINCKEGEHMSTSIPISWCYIILQILTNPQANKGDPDLTESTFFPFCPNEGSNSVLLIFFFMFLFQREEGRRRKR